MNAMVRFQPASAPQAAEEFGLPDRALQRPQRRHQLRCAGTWAVGEVAGEQVYLVQQLRLGGACACL